MQSSSIIQPFLRGKSNKNVYLLTNTGENSMFTYMHKVPNTLVMLIKQRQLHASVFAPIQPLYFLLNSKEALVPQSCRFCF